MTQPLCEDRLDTLNIKQVDLDKTRDLIDHLPNDTPEEYDFYHAEVDKYNVERELYWQEANAFNAECVG